MIPMSRSLRGKLFALPGMITCRELEEFIDDYLEDALRGTEKLKFEFHLSVCQDCRAYLERYKVAASVGQQILAQDERTVAPAEEIPEDLVRAILAAREPRAKDKS